MPINSRAKGAQGEREWAQFLTDRGYPAKRGVSQVRGGSEGPDVVCDALATLHFEVKRNEKLNVSAAVSQATRDAGSKVPLVAHRRSRESWMVTMDAEVFIANFVRLHAERAQATEGSQSTPQKATSKQLGELCEVLQRASTALSSYLSGVRPEECGTEASRIGNEVA